MSNESIDYIEGLVQAMTNIRYYAWLLSNVFILKVASETTSANATLLDNICTRQVLEKILSFVYQSAKAKKVSITTLTSISPIVSPFINQMQEIFCSDKLKPLMDVVTSLAWNSTSPILHPKPMLSLKK